LVSWPPRALKFPSSCVICSFVPKIIVGGGSPFGIVPWPVSTCSCTVSGSCQADWIWLVSCPSSST
jgi:hypothetical protein